MCTRLKLNFYRIYTATAVSFGEQKSSSLAQQRRAHAQFEMPFSVQVSLLDGGITHVRECVWTAWRTPCIYTIDTRTHTHTDTRQHTHKLCSLCTARSDPIRYVTYARPSATATYGSNGTGWQACSSEHKIAVQIRSRTLLLFDGGGGGGGNGCGGYTHTMDQPASQCSSINELK